MAAKDVQDAIRHVRGVIEDYWGYAARNETSTRYVVIDPLIRALGWDLSDIEECEVEYPVRSKRVVSNPPKVDYALFNSDGEVVVLMEAKHLGTFDVIERDVRRRDVWSDEYKSLDEFLLAEAKPKSSDETQLEKYVASARRFKVGRGLRQGVGALTDGQSWHLYDLATTRRVRFDRRRMPVVDIVEGNLQLSARTLHEWLRKERWR